MFLFETVFWNGINGPEMFSLLNLRNAINMRQNIIFIILINLVKVHTDLSMNSSFKNIKILDGNCDYFWLQRSQVFLTNTQAETPQGRKTALGHYPASREEVCIAKTTVPKKGLIKLTALDNELKNPLLFDKKEKEGWLGYSWKV